MYKILHSTLPAFNFTPLYPNKTDEYRIVRQYLEGTWMLRDPFLNGARSIQNKQPITHRAIKLNSLVDN